MKSTSESIICAGFGGQGIMVLGKVLANAGMVKGLHVTWLPSYGAEVRGGTAHTSVKISSSDIGSPVIEKADTEIIMNGPSLSKFEERLAPGGLMVLNTSMASGRPSRGDIDVVAAPLTDEAIKLGNVRVANMIAAGIFAARKKLLGKDVLDKVIKNMAGDRKDIIPVNVAAVERGIEIGNSA